MAGNLLGSKTGDFLTWVTIVMVGVFLTLAVVMAKWYRPIQGSQYLQNQGSQQNQPVTPTTPTGEGTPVGAPPANTEPAPIDTGGMTSPTTDSNTLDG